MMLAKRAGRGGKGVLAHPHPAPSGWQQRAGDCGLRPPTGTCLLLAIYLKEANFVALHAGYRLLTSLSRLFAQPVSCLLRGTQGFFALPEGNYKSLDTLTVTKSHYPPAASTIHHPG